MEYVGIVLVMASFVGTWRALNPRRRAHRRVRKAILARIFAESPAHQLEHLELVHSDGFYAFHADYIVIAENRLIPRSVSGKHNGTVFLAWTVDQGDEVNSTVLKRVYQDNPAPSSAQTSA